MAASNPPRLTAMERVKALLKILEQIEHESRLTTKMLDSIEELVDRREEQREEECRAMQAVILDIQARIHEDTGDDSARLEESKIPGSSIVGDEHSLSNSEGGAQVSDDLQMEVCAAPDVDMANANDAGSSLQISQPAVQQPSVPAQAASPLPTSSEAEDVEMAFAEMSKAMDLPSTPEKNSGDANDVAAASRPYSPRETTPKAAALPESSTPGPVRKRPSARAPRASLFIPPRATVRPAAVSVQQRAAPTSLHLAPLPLASLPPTSLPAASLPASRVRNLAVPAVDASVSSRNNSPRAGTSDLGNAVIPGLLRQIQSHVASQPHTFNFKGLFDLPEHDKKAMDSIVTYLISNETWDGRDRQGTVQFLQDMPQTNPQDMAHLIWNCDVHWYKSKLRFEGDTWFDDAYNKTRVVALRELFDRNAETLFELIHKGLIEKPKKNLNWNHVRGLMQRVEYTDFFRQKGQRDTNAHRSYMQGRIAYWRVPANVLGHVSLASENDKPSNPDAPLLTAHKRTAVVPLGTAREEVSRVKRERLIEEEPEKLISRRRQRGSGDAVAEASSSKRRHDE